MSNNVKFTKNQQAAIDVAGGNILVSAAAGSGKTAVLSERVIRLLTGKNAISPENLVIVTFTVLAAGEMKSRISAKLSDLIDEQPENNALQNQQLLLSNARICTIHSLCSGLIRDNFQAINVSANARIGDETELQIIKNDAVDDVLNALYESEDSEFLQLVEFTTTKADKPLCEMIIKIYDYIRSFPFPLEFLENTLITYQNSKNITDNIWYKDVHDFVIDALENEAKNIDKLVQTISEIPEVYDAYGEAFSSDYSQIVEILQALNENNWDKAVNLLENINKLKLKPIRKYEDKPFLNYLQKQRATCYSSLDGIKNRYLCCTNADFIDDIQILIPKISKLFAIVADVYSKIDEKKHELEIIDYSDLEHYSLNLLLKKTDGGYEKTQLAYDLSENIDEIMIDECQDINEVQNLIFKLLSKNETNIFMVGDVKQSVYRFRKAEPRLFIEKRKKFLPYNEKTHKNTDEATITLESNFRSRNEVCEFVNFIFSQLMSEKIGEIKYDEKEFLVPAAKFSEYEKSLPEVHIINYDKEDERAKQQVEACYVADLIKKMVDEHYQVQGENGTRSCKYGDFAILMRSKKDIANIYNDELKSHGVPCFCDSSNGYFNEYEIAVTLNLLRIIDNPLLDVCLLSVLMSPMFSFDADLVSQIRYKNKNKSFYLAVVEMAKNNLQCQNFIDVLSHLRQQASVLTVDELLQEIYDKTDFISLCYAIGNGEQKDANLRLLLTYAKQYEEFGGGLSGFLRYIDRVISNKQDFSCANTITQSDNTVKIMTIHSSKGLEFPVCIIADCAKKFNKMDLNLRQFQLNPKLFFGMKIVNQSRLQNYTNLPYEAIRLRSEIESISEEMRILYVALTRAKEKLIMVMTMPKAKDKIISLASRATNELTPYDVFKADSYADWIIMSTIRHNGMKNILQNCEIKDVISLDSNFNLASFFIESNDTKIQKKKLNFSLTAKPNDDLKKELMDNFNFVYDREELTKIPVKLTVTQIAKQSQHQQYNLDDCPKFMQEKEITPAKRGTILHKFMQFANFDVAQNDIETEINRLVKKNFITQFEAESLDKNKISAYLRSNLYKRICASKKVLREYKFLHTIKACDIMEVSDKETEILIQGIADCLFFEGDEIVLVDYKTDLTTNEQQLIDRYNYQLKIYKQAIENSFNAKVKQCLLYSMNLEREIEIEF